MRRHSLIYLILPYTGRPTSLFIGSLFVFNRSLCDDLEELDVDSVLLDIVSTISRYHLNLKKLFVIGEEVETWPANVTDV